MSKNFVLKSSIFALCPSSVSAFSETQKGGKGTLFFLTHQIFFVKKRNIFYHLGLFV
jgi:hypothetical protein